jgi:thiaminase/transcriptional activator TenA
MTSSGWIHTVIAREYRISARHEILIPQAGREAARGHGMTGFSDEAWDRTASLRVAIDRLPFITELTAGTLRRDRFRTYITQDALYLGQFSRALAIAAAKAPDAGLVQSFCQSAVGAVVVERALHEKYLREFGVDPAAIDAAEPTPDCLAYTSFLLATAYQEPWEVLVAALLPCFRIYWEVGCAIAAKAGPQNPYRAWIDTYADPGFGEAVQRMVGIVDAAAAATNSANRRQMLGAVIRSSQYEFLFWDGAYQQRGWPTP